MDRDRVVIAEIFKPRGLAGELIARSLTDVPGRLKTIRQATVRLATGLDEPVQIVSAWEHKGDWVLKFAGIDSIEAAERFSRADLWVPPSERGELPDGEFFQTDLVGCRVLDFVTGRELGLVSGWEQYGGPPLMEVMVDGRGVLIPFVEAICKQVNVSAGTILVDLPEGLLDL